MVVFETSSVRVYFDDQAKLLLISWLKKPATKVLREAYLHALQFVTAHPHITLFCTDQSSIGPLEREQENWLNQEYYPKVYQIIQDEIHAAVVFSDAHFKAIVTNYQVPVALPQRSFIHFNYFTNRKEAFLWLDDIKKGQNMAVCPPLS